MAEQTCNDWMIDQAGVNAVAARKFKAVLSDVRGHGYQVMVTQVLRSKEVQRKLYCAGRSDAELLEDGLSKVEIKAARSAGYAADEKPVTGTVNSMHCKGRAMDVVVLNDGKVTWNTKHPAWAVYAAAAKAHGLVAGASFRMRDWPHVEYRI